MTTALKYRARAMVDDLAIGECTIHRASDDKAARWWLLWFFVARDVDGQPEMFAVPVQIGSYQENGAGGRRTWGLARAGAGVWQISPSINVLDDRDAVAGTHGHASIWHQTPKLVDVPDGEPWTTGTQP